MDKMQKAYLIWFLFVFIYDKPLVFLPYLFTVVICFLFTVLSIFTF